MTTQSDLMMSMIRSTMDVFATSCLVLSKTDKDLEATRQDLIQARRLLRNCLDKMDSCPETQSVEDWEHLCRNVADFLGDRWPCKPLVDR